MRFPKPISVLAQPTYTDVRDFKGGPDVPWDVAQQRRASADVYRYLGTPVLIKRMYTYADVEDGYAIEAPSMDSTHKQSTYATDAVSHGVGYVSIETQPGEWYGIVPGTTRPQIMISESGPPYPGFVPAPKYRGYGPGFLTYAIMPDAPEDQWKLTEQGALVRQQTAMIQLPWWPIVGDNDLVIICQLDNQGRITQTFERYQLQQTNPVTFHGRDRRGAREFEGVNANNNRYWLGQTAQLNAVPYPDEIYKVEVDR